MTSTSEHGRFPYSAIVRRPPVTLPDGARIAVWVVPNVEHYHYNRPAMSRTQMTASLRPDVLNYAWRDYGPRVGIWRIMEILERQGFRTTAALNAEVGARYPEIIEEGNRRGWEWMAHGPNNSTLFTGLAEADERALIAGVVATIARDTGRKPRGWLGPALTETDNTLDLLVENGIEYVADWCNDEQPYAMTTRSGPIVAVPYTVEIGDVGIFLEHGGSGDDFYAMIVDQFDQLYEEGKRIPRFMAIALHPFLVGHPYRARHLERALKYIRKRKAVWITTGGEITDWFNGSGRAPGK